MKSRLDTLLQKAAAAEPPQKPGRCTWSPLLPVVTLLINERSHSLADAVNWLVKEGEVPSKNRETAYRSLRALLARRQHKINKSA